MTKEEKQFDLEDRLIDFAVRILRVSDPLPKTKAGNHSAGQIVRSGTSPAPNYGEAQGAESRSDFVHKMKICLKELRETKVWLQMIARADLIAPAAKLDPIIDECDQMICVFVKSIQTANANKNKHS